MIKKLRSNEKIRKILYIAVAFFFFAFVVSVPLFEVKCRIVPYFCISLLGLTSLLYCFLYKTLKLPRVVMIPLLFAAFTFFSTALFSKQFRSWITIVLLCFSIVIFYYSFRTIDNKKICFYSVLFAIVVFSLVFLAESMPTLLKTKDFTLVRLGEQYGNQNSVSAYLAFGCAFSIYCALLFKKRFSTYVLCALTLILCLFCGILTGSRTFLILLAADILLAVVILLHRKPLLLVVVLVSLVALAIIVLNLPSSSGIKHRFLNFFNGLDMSSISRDVWREYGFSLGLQNVLFGWGADGFKTFSGTFSYSHSNFSEVFCNFGIIGFFLFYSSYLWIFSRVLQNNNENNIIFYIFLLNIVIKSFFNVFYIKKLDMMELALMLFCIETFSKKSESLHPIKSNVEKGYYSVCI